MLVEVSTVNVVVVTTGVGVGAGVGLGVGLGVGDGDGFEGVVVPEVDPFADVVVVAAEVKLLAAPPQPVTSANPSMAHNKVPSREI